MARCPICISIARTYYTRAVLLGMLYLAAHRGVIAPGALFFTPGGLCPLGSGDVCLSVVIGSQV
jgi:hypothetical protein